MSSPSKVWGAAPAKKRIWCILNLTEYFWLQDIVNHEVYIRDRAAGEW